MYGTVLAIESRERATSELPLLNHDHDDTHSEEISPSRVPSVDHSIFHHAFDSWLPDHSSTKHPRSHHRRVGISPTNFFVQWFDRLFVLVLFFTGTVTVFIVCILMTQPREFANKFSFPFLLDLLLDVIFLADFVLGFFRSFRLDRGRGRLVFELEEIQHKYVRGRYFVLSFISSIPFDFLSLVVSQVLDVPVVNLRFLRLIRLTRLNRAYRIVEESNWYQHYTLQTDSRKLHMAQLVFGLFMVEHWACCWWIWLGREEDMLEKGRYTWIDRLQENGFQFDRNSELDLYICSFYWASTVSTSTGSGDIVPANPQEAVFVAMFQLLGGCLFAYAVSSLVGLYAALHASERSRGLAIDSVNQMIGELHRESAHVDEEKLRTFVWQAGDTKAARSRRRTAPGGALSQLSQQLRDEVLLAERQPWMERIWFLHGARPRLARAICREAKWVAYAPGDYVTLTGDQCLVFSRGMATTRNVVLVRGSTLGLANLATVPRPGTWGTSFMCFNFVEGLMFDSTLVDRAVKRDGDRNEQKKFKRARVRYGLLRWANHVRAAAAAATNGQVSSS